MVALNLGRGRSWLKVCVVNLHSLQEELNDRQLRSISQCEKIDYNGFLQGCSVRGSIIGFVAVAARAPAAETLVEARAKHKAGSADSMRRLVNVGSNTRASTSTISITP